MDESVEFPGAKPFERLGCYEIKEQSWSNGLPENQMAPDRLVGYWNEIVSAVQGQTARREKAAKQLDAALKRGDFGFVEGGTKGRYSAKIEIKSAEAVVALLHHILTPEAPFLCDDRCSHVTAGATFEQVKRFLDSMDAVVDHLEKVHSQTPSDHPCFEDELEELGVYKHWRDAFARLLQA